MATKHDVIVIGAGSAGLAAVRQVRKKTDNFILINDGPYGTTCARVGCMPSKALIEAAHAFHARKKFEAFGIRGSESLRIDVPAVLQRVRALRDRLVGGVLESTEALGERSIAGRARLLGPNEVALGEIGRPDAVVRTDREPATRRAGARRSQCHGCPAIPAPQQMAGAGHPGEFRPGDDTVSQRALRPSWSARRAASASRGDLPGCRVTRQPTGGVLDGGLGLGARELMDAQSLGPPAARGPLRRRTAPTPGP